MAILRTLQHIFGSLELAGKYARLFELGDLELAARGLTRDTLGQRYLEEVDALDAATAGSGDAKGGLHAPA